jgi:hypothetical protein
MNIDPAPNVMHDSYFSTLEPHHFRFVEQDGEARLNLHDDATGDYLGVYVLVEYAKGPLAYGHLPLAWESVGPLIEWFEEEDKKPF